MSLEPDGVRTNAVAFHIQFALDVRVKTDSPFAFLSAKHGNRWNAITAAREKAARRREDLAMLLGNSGGEVRPDMNFVVFGSLSRGEWTSGSDVDWTLLVDGQTDPEDIRTAKRIEDLLIRERWKEPGPSGVFGSLSFSHIARLTQVYAIF